jgi:hypothetical protein
MNASDDLYPSEKTASGAMKRRWNKRRCVVVEVRARSEI